MFRGSSSITLTRPLQKENDTAVYVSVWPDAVNMLPVIDFARLLVQEVSKTIIMLRYTSFHKKGYS